MTGYRGSHGRERFDLSPGVVARSLYYKEEAQGVTLPPPSWSR